MHMKTTVLQLANILNPQFKIQKNYEEEMELTCGLRDISIFKPSKFRPWTPERSEFFSLRKIRRGKLDMKKNTSLRFQVLVYLLKYKIHRLMTTPIFKHVLYFS